MDQNIPQWSSQRLLIRASQKNKNSTKRSQKSPAAVITVHPGSSTVIDIFASPQVSQRIQQRRSSTLTYPIMFTPRCLEKASDDIYKKIIEKNEKNWRISEAWKKTAPPLFLINIWLSSVTRYKEKTAAEWCRTADRGAKAVRCPS